VAHTRDDMIETLRDAGFRLTRQRVTIIDRLAGREDHPSAREIYRGLLNTFPRTSLATVYNTLRTLVELGLVREMDFEAADNRYDTNVGPHINLVCTVCGAITDFDHELPVSPEEIRGQLGFEAVDCRMEYRGVCARCLAAENDSPAVGRVGGVP